MPDTNKRTRGEVVYVRVTPSEKLTIANAARQCGLQPGAWARNVILVIASGAGMAPGLLSPEVIAPSKKHNGVDRTSRGGSKR